MTTDPWDIAPPFASCEEAVRAFAGETSHHVYARINHPMQEELALRYAEWEGAPAGHVVSSGTGANSQMLSYLLIHKDREHPWWDTNEPRPNLIMPRCSYGGTIALAQSIPTGITFINDPFDLESWRKAFVPGCVNVVFLETPTNPLIQVLPIPSIAHIAREHHAACVVDNTMGFGTLRPLELGATHVVTSLTKYLRVWIGGAMAGPEEDMRRILLEVHRHAGHCMSPDVARQNISALETMHITWKLQSKTAAWLAKQLSQHAHVCAVHYPTILSGHRKDIAWAMMHDEYGAVFSFDVGDKATAWAVIDKACMRGYIENAANFGNVTTLLIHPATTTHALLSEEHRAQAGITDGLIRVSCGVQAPKMLLDRISWALDHAA